MTVDLRSDTLTRPGPEMRQAMAEAEVGDDVYAEDPTTNELERRVAELFGHEAALLVPTGTMGNQIGIRLLVPPGDELVCDLDAHVVTYELGGLAAIGGVQTRTYSSTAGVFDLDQVVGALRPEGHFAVPTRAVAVEQTHNRAGGAIIPLDLLERLRAETAARGIALHCDGARIWNAMVATGVTAREYGALFDTLSVCLSKGLGAPVGSVLIASAERIARARSMRKQLGGGMRQTGLLAAAGLWALDHNVQRLADDHARAARLAELLGRPRPQTNIVSIDLSGTGREAAPLAAAAREQGVLISVVGPTRVRLVLHLDVTDADVERAAEVLAPLLPAAG